MKKRNILNKIKDNKYFLIVLFIFLFALTIRLYHLDKVPAGLWFDEALTGYNSYSILHTDKDYIGHFPFPTVSHNPSEEPLYNFLAILPISILDLNIFSIRFMAALFGALAVISAYLFSKELFNKRVGIISALLVAISPWMFHFSRIAFRASLMPFFITLSSFLLLKFIKSKKGIYALAASVSFGLCLYVYSTAKLLVPLFIVGLCSFYIKDILSDKKLLKQNAYICCLSIFILILIAAPIYYDSFFGQGSLRFNAVSVFSTDGPMITFIHNMLSHISPEFLFLNGDSNIRHCVPGFGEILLVSAPFIALAAVYSIFKRKKEGLLLLCLILLAIIPSSLTNEGIPHALRSLSAAPFVEIIAAFGIFLFLEYLSKMPKYLGVILIIILIFAIAANSVFFFYSYFSEYPLISSEFFNYGLEEAIGYAENNSNYYDHIILVEDFKLDQMIPAHILFFTKVDPYKYQQSRYIGKYVFCENLTDDCSAEGPNLFITTERELPADKKLVYSVYNKKGGVLYILFE